MFRCIEYTAFLWKAKGRHGTHSPFAYWLVDTVGRQKQGTQQLINSAPAAKHALRFIAKLRNCLPQHRFEPAQPNASHLVATSHNNLATIYLLSCEQLENWLLQTNFSMHQESILVVYDLKEKRNQVRWQQLCQSSAFHFSADCFHFGILSPRPGQAKQHFYLKLN